ncbi:unnamed protein product [Peronospora farinosa]|uniref:Uncharacterized protein n=1 Tax=Peronospora farinosa TaxID=134698 RepID=A0ABN8BVQ6_9STRA|nr:unnamed protein product [Peronospora farinosa]
MSNCKNKMALVIGVTALFIGSANAHAYMTVPKVKWLPTLNDQTAFVVAIQSAETGWTGPFNGPPADNTRLFWNGFKKSKFKDIREFVEVMGKVSVAGATMKCGQTDPNAPPQPLPDMLEWTGFTGSHEGPCVAYCDDFIVFEDTDCAAHFNMTPAVMPYKKELCIEASILRFLWIALHGLEWQVYINCAPLKHGKGGTTPKVKIPPSTPFAEPTAPPSTPSAEPTTPPSTPPTEPTSTPSTPSPEAQTPPSTPPTEAQTPPSTPPTEAQTPPSTPPADPPATKSNNEKCVRRRTLD